MFRETCWQAAVAMGLVAAVAAGASCSPNVNSASPLPVAGAPQVEQKDAPVPPPPLAAHEPGDRAGKKPSRQPVTQAPAPVSCAASSFGESPLAEEIAKLRGIVRRSPSNAVLHTCLANALFDAGRLAEAIDEYRKAIRLDAPLEAHRNLAYALLDGGQPKAATRILERALRLAPGDPALRATLRAALRSIGRHP